MIENPNSLEQQRHQTYICDKLEKLILCDRMVRRHVSHSQRDE